MDFQCNAGFPVIWHLQHGQDSSVSRTIVAQRQTVTPYFLLPPTSPHSLMASSKACSAAK